MPNNTISPQSYESYRGLPALVGLLSMEEATEGGLTVGESVDRLKRIHWALFRLHDIFVQRLAAMPVYELKMAFSLHSHYCAEHVATIRTRVREMREPPYGLDKSPNTAIDVFFDEILAAPNTEALVLGIYEKAVPAVIAGLKQHLDKTNRLLDHPTYRVCRFALLELEDVAEYGRKAVACIVDSESRLLLEEWLALLEDCLLAAGDLDGTQTVSEGPALERLFSNLPYVYDGTPQRDERFQDSYNMGVNAEAMLLDPAIAPKPKTLMLYYKRLREIDVPEMMASILAQTKDKPWEYTRDMTRQLWDEARHAMMGEIGFVSLGIDWTQIPINFTWSLGLNSQLSAEERHAVLFYIEQGLMPAKTGKRYEWEVAVASSDQLSAKIQDYDWADEILHARIGRDWFVSQFGSIEEAMDYGSECWSRVLSDWSTWKDEGLTEHRNWWPDIYRQACNQWGVEPNPDLLAFNISYEHVRADLKNV